MRGLTLIRQMNPESQHILQIKNLEPGIYFIELEKDGFKETRKQIVN